MAVLTAEQALAKVDALYKVLTGRRSDIKENLDYYAGRHPLAYATIEWSQAHGQRFANFSDNWCRVVGDAPAERTGVDGFRVGDDSDPISDDERLLDSDWQRNEMEAQSSQGFLLSTVAKRSSVLVWADEDGLPLDTWERPDQVVVDYDPGNPRRKRAALKAWLEDDFERATLYTADAVWKFRRPRASTSGLILPAGYEVGGWVPFQADGDDTWPIANPLGEVPVVEFANAPMLGGEPISDIDGAKAMQNAVNLLWSYLFTAADYASMPARVVMGQAPPKMPILDENGQKVGEKPVDIEALTKGRMLWLTGQSTSIGQWDAAKLDVFTEVIKVAVMHVSAQTRTPIADLLGELGNVNGETLQALAQPLAMKVRRSHAFYTPRIRDVHRLNAAVRGMTSLAEACRSGIVQWRNPEVFGESQVADAASKDKAIGFPLQWIAEKRYGYSQKEVQRLLDMARAEATDPYLALLGEKSGAPVAAGVG